MNIVWGSFPTSGSAWQILAEVHKPVYFIAEVGLWWWWPKMNLNNLSNCSKPLIMHSFFDELSAGSDREQCCSSYGCSCLGSAGYFNANGEHPTVQQERCYLRKPFFLMVLLVNRLLFKRTAILKNTPLYINLILAVFSPKIIFDGILIAKLTANSVTIRLTE